MKSLLAVLAVLLLVPAAASAQSQRQARHGRLARCAASGPAQSGSARAVRRPDPGPWHRRRGTRSAVAEDRAGSRPWHNVAAPDQQSPTIAPAPVHVVAPAPGFDWGTAAIGAATSLLLMTALFGIAVTVRRRHSVITG